jgi:hypothetical protein
MNKVEETEVGGCTLTDRAFLYVCTRLAPGAYGRPAG